MIPGRKHTPLQNVRNFLYSRGYEWSTHYNLLIEYGLYWFGITDAKAIAAAVSLFPAMWEDYKADINQRNATKYPKGRDNKE